MTGVNATLNKLNKDFKEYLERTAMELKSDLQDFTPTRSGNARKGWKTTISNNAIEVSNSVAYIERLENNHSPQTKGQGIVKPALSSFNRRNKK